MVVTGRKNGDKVHPRTIGLCRVDDSRGVVGNFDVCAQDEIARRVRYAATNCRVRGLAESHRGNDDHTQKNDATFHAARLRRIESELGTLRLRLANQSCTNSLF